MSGKQRINNRAKANKGRVRAGGRAQQRHVEVSTWLGTGAVTLGVGAALVSGSGLAHADTTKSGGAPSDTTGNSSHSTTSADSTNSTSKGSGDSTAPSDSTGTAGASGGDDGAKGPKKSPQVSVSNTGGAQTGSRPSQTTDSAAGVNSSGTADGQTDAPTDARSELQASPPPPQTGEPASATGLAAPVTVSPDKKGGSSAEVIAPSPDRSSEPVRMATELPVTKDGQAPPSAPQNLAAGSLNEADSPAPQASFASPTIDITPAQPDPVVPTTLPEAPESSVVLATLGFAPLSNTDTPLTPPAAPLSAALALVVGRRQQQEALLTQAPGTKGVTTDTSLVEGTAFTTAAVSMLAAGKVGPTVRAVPTPPGQAPIVVNDAFTTAEDTVYTGPLNVLANDRDPQGTALTAAVVTGPTNGTLTFNADGSFTYTPAAGYNGTDFFEYKAKDGRFDSSPARVDITVSSVNDAPVITSVTPGDPDQDGNVTVTVVTTDADGDAPTFSFTPHSGAVTLVDAANGTYKFTYTPTSDARIVAAGTDGADSDTFTVTVDDKHGGTDTESVTVTIAPADIESNPEAVYAAAQSLVMASIPTLMAHRADFEDLVRAHFTLAQQQLDATEQAKLFAETELLAEAANIAQGASAELTAGMVTGAMSIAGGSIGLSLNTAAGLASLSELQDAKRLIDGTQISLGAALETRSQAGALAQTVAPEYDGSPVFVKYEYTAAADRTVTGQVFFIDPDNDPAHPLTFSAVEESTQFLDPTCASCFTMPPPDPNNPVDPDIVTFHVQVTDSDFNVVTKAITVDRTGVAPPADTPSDQLVKSYAGIFADKADAMASLSAKALEAEAERLQAVQQNDQELVAALVEVIRDLTDQIQAYIASIESTSGQAVQRLLNV